MHFRKLININFFLNKKHKITKTSKSKMYKEKLRRGLYKTKSPFANQCSESLIGIASAAVALVDSVASSVASVALQKLHSY